MNEGSTHWENCYLEHQVCAWEEIDRLRTKLAECKRRADRLEAAIRETPHNNWCRLNEGEHTGECDCWKCAALKEE